MVSFSGGKTFLEAEFEVLANGTANVALTMEELNLGYQSGGAMSLASLVEDSVIKSVTGITGFTDTTVTATSTVESGSAPVDTLTINSASNYFPAQTITVDKDADRVNVVYRLKASKPLINAQWNMTYDTNKLELFSYNMPKVGNALYVEPQAGMLNGNFTDSDGVKFLSTDNFLILSFKVKGTGITTVNLNINILGVAAISGSNVRIAYPVDNGVVQDVTGQSGFSSYTSSQNTYEVLTGDVNNDGIVNIQDATVLQQYLAEFDGVTLNIKKQLAADVKTEGVVDVRDVTAIQRMLLV